ncbi:MAG: hypothetical protein K2N02_03280, partial [Alistipes sp.]|nr:hypothetical protein [Alistipes sp.]
ILFPILALNNSQFWHHFIPYFGILQSADCGLGTKIPRCGCCGGGVQAVAGLYFPSTDVVYR